MLSFLTLARTVPGGAANGRVVQAPAAPDDCRRDSELLACREALRQRRVTFHDVATVWFALCDDALPEDQREPLSKLFADLLNEFADPRGGIVTAYFCRHIRVAAALTSSDVAADNPERVISSEEDLGEDEREQEPLVAWLRGLPGRLLRGNPFQSPRAVGSAIHIEAAVGDPKAWEAKEILFRCQELHYRALEFLTPKPRKICLRMVFGVITSLLGSLDARQSEKPGEKLAADEIAGLHLELSHARQYVSRSMQRQAQLEYFVGMLWGWAAVLGSFVGMAIASAITGERWLIGDPLILSAVAGGVGAVVSVMQRMTSGRLRLAAEDGRRTIRILGGIRPVLGAILGVVLCVLLGGGLLPFEQQPAGIQHLQYYIVALAFIAGFSERFAQDMITGAAGGGPRTDSIAVDRPQVVLDESGGRLPGALSLTTPRVRYTDQ